MNRTRGFLRNEALMRALHHYAKRATVAAIAAIGNEPVTSSLVNIMKRAPRAIERELQNLLMEIESNCETDPAEDSEDRIIFRTNENAKLTVVLDGLADLTKKIELVRAVREITKRGLKEAKDLVEGAPKAVKEHVGVDEAEALKKKLEESGAKVSLE